MFFLDEFGFVMYYVLFGLLFCVGVVYGVGCIGVMIGEIGGE